MKATSLHEAAEVLLGLAAVLHGVQGVWAEDARHDAQRIRDLAHALADLSPRSAHTGAAEADESWDEVLALYLRRGLAI